ncbi:MAG: hypothetical protein ACE3JK_08010 [Sporolactobacillus sp.]
MSGYYDFIRATEGMDPETDRKFSVSFRIHVHSLCWLGRPRGSCR